MVRSTGGTLLTGPLPDFGVGPFDWCSIDLAQNRICKPSRSRFMMFHELDTFVNCCVRRNSVKISQLKDCGTQRDNHRAIKLRNFAARIKRNQVIELGLISQTAENDLRSKPRVAALERPAVLQKSVGGVLPSGHRSQDLEGGTARGRNFPRKNHSHRSMKNTLLLMFQ